MNDPNENLDSTALRRLLPLVADAIAAQDEPVARRLQAAWEAGNTVLRTEMSVIGPVCIVVIAGQDLLEVAVAHLIKEDD